MSDIAIIRATDPEALFELAGTVGWNQTLRDCREMILAPASAGILRYTRGV